MQIAISFDINLSKIPRIIVELLDSTICCKLISPFNMRLREDLGILYEMSSAIEHFSFGSLFYMIFEVHKTNAKMLIEEITKLLVNQKETLDEKSFECAKMAFTYGKEDLRVYPSEFSHLAIYNDVTTPQEYLDKNQNVSYLDVQKAAREIFKPENMVFLIHDAPNEQELLDILYKNKEILRKELGA